MKRHEIQVLKRAGKSNAEAASATGVSPRTVKRVSKEPSIETYALPEGRPRRGRPSKVDEVRPFVEELLRANPELPTREVFHRLRERGYRGGKSAVYDLVSRSRPTPSVPLVRFEGVPGEFSQHDFGHVDVRFKGGRVKRIHFFASRLKYSRLVHVRIVPDEKVESLVRSLLAAFETFGGVPLVCVFDNPKTVVLRHRGNEIEWNTTFAQVALDYRFAPELCTPRRANQKGSVENLVGFVKGSFFKVREFHDEEDLEAQLQQWHLKVNDQEACRATKQVPRARMAEEAPRLRPLTIPAEEYALRFPVMVGPTARVLFAGAMYSMSPRTIGWSATLFLYRDRVRIVAGDFSANHPRLASGAPPSELPEHRTEMLARISGQRGRLYFKRQRLLELGNDAERLITEIVHRHPRSWAREVEILFDLLEMFGEDELRQAIEHAVERQQFAVMYVHNLLERGVA